MFARIVTMDLKPGEGPNFAAIVDEKHVPVLRKYPGFRDELAMVSSDGKQAVAISLWDSAQAAAVYHREAYAEIVKTVEGVAAGKPVLKTYDLTTSTAHHVQTHTMAV